MAMLHCTDCEFGTFEQSEKTGRWRGTCQRGYTLANPRVFEGTDMYFTDHPDELVPVKDRFGREYLRTKAICDKYVHLSEVDKAKDGNGGIRRFFESLRKTRKERETGAE